MIISALLLFRQESRLWRALFPEKKEEQEKEQEQEQELEKEQEQEQELDGQTQSDDSPASAVSNERLNERMIGRGGADIVAA
jgi:hypothetical protein